MDRFPAVRLPPEWGADPVPPEQRRLRAYDVFVLWFSLGVGLLVLAAGALLTAPVAERGFGLSLAEALVAIVAGSVVGSAMLAVAGLVGTAHAVPSMVSLRAILGRAGSYAPTALNVVQLVGWAAFEVMIMGEAAARILGHSAGSAVAAALVIAFGLFCALLALGGPVAVVRKWLEKFAVWLVIASSAWITYVVFARPTPVPWGGFASGPSALLLGIDLVIAMPVSWWPLVSDYNRFAARRGAAFGGTFAGYALANTWFFFLGAAMVVALGVSDLIASIAALSMGTLALLLILVDETDNGFANVYSTAVSLQNWFPRQPQRRFVAVVAGASVVFGVALIAIGGFAGAAAVAYEGFLFLIGGAFVPLLGVVASDVLVVRSGGYRLEEFYGPRPRVRWESVAAWIVGASAYAYLWWTNYGGGIGWPTLTVGLSLPSFAVAFGLHLALARAKLASRAGARSPGA